jgi:aspartyl-tRNA(Asn)/glutamyl-tRNA(Gln) amidotransferase subunit B
MRSKEEAMDYRYFPDPDLLPVEIDKAHIESVRETLPELPDAKRARFVSDYGLSEYDAGFLTSSRDMADYYETVAKESAEAKLAANWVMGELSSYLNKEDKDIADSPVSASMLAGMIKRIKDNTISGKIAKDVFEAMWQGEGDADAIIESKGLKQITDTGAIEALVDEVLANNPQQVEQFKAGKEKMLGYFVGQIMKATQGKANPAQVNELLRKKLK